MLHQAGKLGAAISGILDRAGGMEVMVFCGVAKLARGMPGNPHDLDLLVYGRDIGEMDRRLGGWRVSPPGLSDNEFFSGTLAKYRVDGIDVDVSGGILAKGGSCDFLLELDKELVFKAMEFSARPLFIPLEEQLIFDFVRRDKPEKAGALVDYFREHRPDMEFLGRRLEKHRVPDDVSGRLLAALGAA